MQVNSHLTTAGRVFNSVGNQIKEKLFKGATFMGDGSVGLILDIEGTADFCDLTEKVVEDYYIERGFSVPEYSYILHDRQTDE